jgi:hypothetical protein
MILENDVMHVPTVKSWADGGLSRVMNCILQIQVFKHLHVRSLANDGTSDLARLSALHLKACNPVMHNIDCRTWYSLSTRYLFRFAWSSTHVRSRVVESRDTAVRHLPSQWSQAALFETRKHCDLVSCWLSVHKSHDNAPMQCLSQCFACERR